MEFPRLVYKDKGPHPRKGGTYSFAGVDDEEQLEQHLADGWSMSLEEAIAPKPAEPPAPPTDTAEPTRDEAIQKLEELGIVFDRRLGKDKLLKLIDEAHKARAT